MTPKRTRKIALYLEYIALVMRKDADEQEAAEKAEKAANGSGDRGPDYINPESARRLVNARS